MLCFSSNQVGVIVICISKEEVELCMIICVAHRSSGTIDCGLSAADQEPLLGIRKHESVSHLHLCGVTEEAGGDKPLTDLHYSTFRVVFGLKALSKVIV